MPETYAPSSQGPKKTDALVTAGGHALTML
jgi:hypothetical protein